MKIYLLRTSVILLLFLNVTKSCKAQTSSMVYKNITSAVYYPDTITQVPDGHYFIEFKEAYFGKPELFLESSGPDTIIVKIGEKSVNAIYVDTNPPGTVRFLTDTLPLLNGRHWYKIKIQEYSPPAWAVGMNYNVPLPDSIGNVMPFRYVEIDGYKGKLNKKDIRQTAYFYPFNDSASFCRTSSDKLNQVWHLCKHTIKATSFTGIYIDGDRERRPYEGDAFINQLSHYVVDSEYAMARKTIDYLFRRPTWPTEWHFHMHMMLWEDYMYTGNKDYLKLYYDSLKRIVDNAPVNKDGLIFDDGNDIIDWPSSERDGYKIGKINNVPNAFYYNSLRIMAKIAGVIDNKPDSVIFANKAEKLKQVFNQIFWNNETNLYIDAADSLHSSVHANIFPVVFGLASESQIDKIKPFIKSKGMAVSVYGSQYLLEALLKIGEASYAEDLMTANTDRSWLNMIKHGGTITWEAWNERVKNNLDWNHAWGTAPANIIARCIFGIRPLEPGFQKALIQPQFGWLTSGKFVQPTINGPIQISFEKNEKSGLNLQVTLNMPAKLILPADKYNSSDIRLNNSLYKPVIQNNNMVINIPAGDNRIHCKLK